MVKYSKHGSDVTKVMNAKIKIDGTNIKKSGCYAKFYSSEKHSGSNIADM